MAKVIALGGAMVVVRVVPEKRCVSNLRYWVAGLGIFFGARNCHCGVLALVTAELIHLDISNGVELGGSRAIAASPRKSV